MGRKKEKRPRYNVDGNMIRGLFGAIEYDFLDSPQQAEDLCRLLNSGVNPRWEVLGEAYRKLLESRSNGGGE